MGTFVELTAPRFKAGFQHDAGEFLEEFLNLLDADYKLGDSTSFVKEIFGGKTSSTLTFDCCGGSRMKVEDFFVLHLAIVSALPVKGKYVHVVGKNANKSTTLEACLNHFATEEILDEVSCCT